MMRFISLFAGIGGIDLGLERAGWECVAQVENDPWCQEILAKHWPEVPKYGDVRELPASALPPTDAIVGGFPCQPVSLAGERQAQSDPRWLWPHFARLVDEIRPRIVIVENVPGLRTAGGAEVIADLAALGYDAELGCVPAAAVGAPHIRARIFVVAHSRSSGRQQDARSPYGDEGQDEGRSEEKAHVASGDGEGRGEGSVADAASITRYEPQAAPSAVRGEGPTGAGGCPQRQLDNWWVSEPDVGRVAHGISRRVDRLRGLGNAVVPQVAEWVARNLVKAG